MARTPSSLFLWLAGPFSEENLYRSLLFAEAIQLPYASVRCPNSKAEKLVATFVNRGLLILSEAADVDSWDRQTRELPAAHWRDWYFYFARAICRGFAKGGAEIEWHEAGHRIADAWDKGEGLFPPKLFPQGELVEILAPRNWIEFSKELWAELEREPLGATGHERWFAVNAAISWAQQKLLLDAAVRSIEQLSAPYTRLGLLAANSAQVNWIRGLLAGGVTFDCTDQDASSLVIQAALGRPGGIFELSKIPPDRFCDLCSTMADAREAFGLQVVRWTEAMSRIGGTEERRLELSKLSRDEIVPAMRSFNLDLKSKVAGALGAVESSQYSELALAAFSAAAASTFGLPLEGIITAGVAGAGAASTVAVGRHILKEIRQRRRSWTAFSIALHNELRKAA